MSIAFLTITSCKKGGVFCYKADNDIVTDNRELTDFTKIDLGLNASVFVEQGDVFNVAVETSKNLLDIIETTVSENTLKIDLKKGKCIKNNFDIIIHITMPTLRNVAISGSGNLYVLKSFTTTELDISVSGSGNIEMDSLTVQQLNTSISGSGKLFLRGEDTVETHSIKISGSGKAKTIGLPTTNSNITVSGSGNCDVYAIENLDVIISGSGNIKYKGDPTITQAISGSGTIKPY